MKHTAHEFIVICTLLVLLLTSCETRDRKLPDIVLICADDLGWSDIGCYGSEIATPNLDALAEQGMRFTQFHNTSKCFPSRASLITGVYAQQCGYAEDFNRPVSHAVTLGEVLHTAGYLTLWSGKHHGLENPYFRGFDRYYGLKDGACNHFNPGVQRPGEGVPARKGPHGQKRIREWCIDSVLYRPYTPEEADFYTTDYFTNYAVRWLEEYKEDKRPVFLYLAYTAPHDPLMAWPGDIEKYAGRYDQGYEKIRNERYRKQRRIGLIDSTYRLSEPAFRDWDSLDSEQKGQEARKMEIYAAMIDRLDQNIGRIIRKLAETGRDRNTLILFMSDNGASAEMVDIGDDYGEMGTLTRWTSLGGNWANVGNTPLRYYKNYSYEGGINTPLIAYWPGKIMPGSIRSFPAHFIDIMATLVDITGAEYPSTYNGERITPMQGESLYPVFLGKEVSREGDLFWEWRNGQAVRSGEWKLVREGLDREWDLYRVSRDPCETLNLAAQYPDTVRNMEQLFKEWKSKVGGTTGN